MPPTDESASKVQRLELAGLDRARSYLTLSFDVDAEALWLVVSKGKNRPSLVSQGLYGLHHGIPRILELLTEADAKATFFVPGLVAAEHPAIVKEIASEGHEIASHSYTHMPLSALTAEVEWDDLRRTKDLLEELTDKPVVGFGAPVCDVSERTINFLVRLGFVYDRSYLDSDWPYIFRSSGGHLLELPVSWVLDDFSFFGHNLMPTMGWGIQDPKRVGEIWRDELETFRQQGGFGCLVLHPEVVGRRTRIAVLRDLVLQLRASCRFHTCIEVAEEVIDLTTGLGGVA